MLIAAYTVDVVVTCSFDGKFLVHRENLESCHSRAHGLLSHCLQHSVESTENQNKRKFAFDNPMKLSHLRRSWRDYEQHNEEKNVATRIKETLQIYEFEKYYYFFGSVFIHTPWIVALFIFHESITYQPRSENQQT
jgi:hypothetical protein